MSYVGNVPTTAAFPFDQFSGNASTTAFTLSYAPAGTTSIIVSISGVVQNPNTYSVSGTTLTFTPAPPTGTNNIAVLYLGLPVVATLSPGNTAYFSSSVFTATAGQTVFTPSGTYQTGFINVIRNGSQLAPANYTATNGTTVTLANACTAGDIVVIEVFNLTSIAGALPVTGGTVTGATTFNSGVNLATSSGNVGIGTSSPAAKLDVNGVEIALKVVANNGGIKLVSSENSTNTGYAAFFNGTSRVGYIGYADTTNGLTLATDAGSSMLLRFVVDGTERARIPAAGGFLLTSDGGGLGYGTGSGGTVTQATNKATTVTLNKPTGRITMNGAALAANTNVQFVVNNSLVSASDVVLLTINDANGPNYQVQAYVYGAGTFTVNLRNITGGSLSNALVLNFAVIKGATS